MRACIAGMHRSGTSMVAKLLRSAGLYLGEERDLMPALPDNQDGFWEHVGFVELNDAILDDLGGWWDCPPARPPGWDERQAEALKPRVSRLLAGFATSERWGWKDPRNSLTLPFWLRFLPDLRVVVCLRNPLEVALSLRRRNTFSYALSLRLWHAYNHAVLAATRPDQRVVTHYDAHFRDPRGEARRLLDFLGIEPTEEAVSAAASAPSAQLRHNRLTTQDLLDADVPREVFELYVRMCAEAGWLADGGAAPVAPAPVAELPPEPPAEETPVSLVGAAKLDRLGLLRREVESLGRRLAVREAEFKQLEAIVTAGGGAAGAAARELREQLLEQESLLRETSARLKLAESREQPLRAMLLEAQRRLVEREEELEAVLAAEREQGRQLRQHLESLRNEPPPAAPSPVAEAPPVVDGYQKMLGRIRDVAQVALPPGATVIVVSKGDEQLTALEGRRAWHFPRGADGQYAGHYPRDSADAVERLEALREEAAGGGGDVFLVLPSTAYWWLDHYGGFKEHLAARYTVTWRDEACMIVSLARPAGQNGRNGQATARELPGRHDGHDGPGLDRGISPGGAQSRGVPPAPAGVPELDRGQGETQNELNEKLVPDRLPRRR